jgi:hypothetical protein
VIFLKQFCPETLTFLCKKMKVILVADLSLQLKFTLISVNEILYLEVLCLKIYDLYLDFTSKSSFMFIKH